MSDKILAAVEEVKDAGKALQEISDEYESVDARLLRLREQHAVAMEAMRQAERKLKGVIFEETHS